MTGIFKDIAIGVLIVVCAALLVGGWLKDRRIDNAEKAVAVAELSADIARAEARAAQGEAKIQTVTRTVYLAAKEAVQDVQKVDPQCANGPELVSTFHAGLERLRQAAPDRAGDLPAE